MAGKTEHEITKTSEKTAPGQENAEIKTQQAEKNKESKQSAKKPSAPEQKKRKKKRIRGIVLLAALVLVLIVILRACGKGAGSVSAVRVVHPVTGSIEEEVSLTGTVESEEIKVCFAPVSGRLAQVNVEAGDAVKAGDILVSYDMESMEEQLVQAQLQYTVSNSSYNNSLLDDQGALVKMNGANISLPILEQQIADSEAYIKALEAQIDKIQTETASRLALESANLQKELIEQQNKPDPDLEVIVNLQKQIQDNAYQTQVAAYSETLRALQLELKEEQERLAWYKENQAQFKSQKEQADAALMSEYERAGLTANESLSLMNWEKAQADYAKAAEGFAAAFSGIVTEVNVVEGQPVTEGMQVLTLASSEGIRVSVKVTKYDLMKVAVGQKAVVTINGREYEGTVEKIDRMASQNASGTAMVGVQIHIENPDDNIYLGLDAKVVISTNRADNALLIPVEALGADKNGDFVYVVEDGVAVRRDVVTGISTAEYIEVKEGLDGSDEIILSSYNGVAVEEGVPVAVMPGGAE